MVVHTLLERQAADDAQALAIRAMKRRDRLGQLDRLADGRLQVEFVVVGQAGDVRLVVDRQGAAGRQVECREVLLLEADLDGEFDVAQTAAALESERRSEVRVGQDPAVGPEQPDPAIDRAREPQVLAQIDRDVLDLEDAIRTGIVGQQAGDVPGERPVVRPARPHRELLDGWTASSSHRSPAPPSSPVSSVSSDERRSSSRVIPFLMLWSVLTTSPSRPTSTPTAYSSAPARISSASRCALAMISRL